MTNLDLTQVIPAQLSDSEAPSRDPDISRAKRDKTDHAQAYCAGLSLGSLLLAQMRWIPDLRFAERSPCPE